MLRVGTTSETKKVVVRTFAVVDRLHGILADLKDTNWPRLHPHRIHLSLSR